MDLRKSLIILVCSLSITCISCGSDDFFEDDVIILRNDSIHNNGENNHNNDSTTTDSTKTNINPYTNPTNNTENNSYNIDSLFTDTTSVVSITGFSKYMNQSSSGSVQGAAAYGDYLFQFQDQNKAVYIYNLAKKSLVKKITLTPNSSNHCNQASFSDIFYSDEDKFPLLYVSGSGNKDHNHIQVYRITGEEETIDITQIQEIILPSRNSDNMCYYTCSILDNENHYLYAYASNASTRLIKFNIPDLQQDTVKLTDSDIIEYILVDHIDHQQGGIIKDGIFYMIYGVPGWGDLVWLRLFDLVAKKEIIRYNLSEKKFTGEPESIFFYKNELYAATNNSGIYKIMFAKKL